MLKIITTNQILGLFLLFCSKSEAEQISSLLNSTNLFGRLINEPSSRASCEQETGLSTIDGKSFLSRK